MIGIIRRGNLMTCRADLIEQAAVAIPCHGVEKIDVVFDDNIRSSFYVPEDAKSLTFERINGASIVNFNME